MKKSLTFLLLTLLSLSASADFMVGELFYRIIGNNNFKQVMVTRHASCEESNDYNFSGDLIIPDDVTYNDVTYSVTSIGDNAFKWSGWLTSVTIPNSVTSIGERAFEDCSGLTSVTIPNSVISIGERAFVDCSGLLSITIPNSVTYIGDAAFEGTPWYNSQPDGLVYAGLVAYHYKGTMLTGTSIALKSDTKSIAVGCFQDCSGLTSVTIPNSVIHISEKAFYHCSSLISLTIPNSVTYIGGSTFTGCTSLTSVNISNSVRIIGRSAFYGCSGLTSVNIPNSVTTIGEWAFFNCSGLTSVTIPNSVTKIGDAAFGYCKGLTSVHISDVAAWCRIQFSDYGVSNPLSYAHNLYLNGEKVTNLIIPDSVTTIGDRAFRSCTSLTSVTIPNSVTTIGDWAFFNCSGLTNLTLPNSITTIGEGAFQSCTSLQEIHSKISDPSKVSMDSYVFYNVPKSTCMLYVPAGTYYKYSQADPWKDFTHIIEESSDIQPADVNGDGAVDVGDLNIIVNVSLGRETNPKADVNGDGVVDVADLNANINAMLAAG